MNKTYSLEYSPLYKLRNRRKLAKLLILPDNYFRVFRVYKYNEFSKPKENGDGERHYMSPEAELKKIQRKIYNLIKRIEIPEWVKSAKQGESYITNCKSHINSKYVLTMDISKFYDSTSKEYIYRLFDNVFQMEPDIASIMTNLLMNGERLPTGGPASQTIVFWAYKDMFNHMNELAKKYDCIFTLYVDDMTFSSQQPISKTLQNNIIKLLSEYGLTAKREKSCYYSSGEFKKITGCGINSKGELVLPNAKRKKIIDQLKLCKEITDIKEIERLNGMLCSARQIEEEIFPSIHIYLKGYQSALNEYARQRQKKRYRSKKIELK
jgi:RNA-directed DNA polymerase